MSFNIPIAVKEPKAVSPATPGYEPMAKIAEWHKAVEQTRFIEEPDAIGRKKSAELRLALIREEFKEVADELLDMMNGHGDRVKLAKELADLLYVVYGTADVFEIPLQAVFNEVHASNMTKVGPDGKVEKREDGKILKSKNYKEPDIARVVLP